MIRSLFLAGLLFLQGADGPAPNYPPDTPDDQRPPHCDNFKTTMKKCHCLRDRQKCDGQLPSGPEDVRMDKTCDTYCHHQNCSCAGMACRS